MKSQLAVSALENAVRTRHPTGTVVHSDRGSQFRSRRFVESLRIPGLTGSMGRVGACADNATMESFSTLLQANVLNRQPWPAGRSAGWPSLPGSKGCTTAGEGNDVWENSLPSNMKQSTRPPSQRPKPRANKSRGRPIGGCVRLSIATGLWEPYSRERIQNAP